MLIKQDAPAFSPITIILGTARDAETFWQMILCAEKTDALVGAQKDMAIMLSDFFTSKAHL